ncbi:hypothetical protein TA3x_000429 [Tundrisphaera sp. TA3]|uniref:hypothetical protein n=1 Tax=Tundrisphaera sp. TA3 TaxID=3435775 RepID=UPI003EC0E021
MAHLAYYVLLAFAIVLLACVPSCLILSGDGTTWTRKLTALLVMLFVGSMAWSMALLLERTLP